MAASVGLTFVLAEVTSVELSRAAPMAGEFRRVVDRSPQLGGRLSIHLYAQDARDRLRARMFSPLAGTYEDPATGSANGALAAQLVYLSGAESQSFEISQGVEMGRPSLLDVTASRGKDGVRAWIRGSRVPVFAGRSCGDTRTIAGNFDLGWRAMLQVRSGLLELDSHSRVWAEDQTCSQTASAAPN